MSDKKHILLVAPYVTFPEEMGMNRFISLAILLAEKFNVTLLTSRFCHSLKKFREIKPVLKNVDIVQLDELGYKKNISIQRLLSHHKFCQNFEQFLRNYDKKIDIVYSAYPLIRTNYILGKYKELKGYKLVIDVQDVWPESISGPIAFFSTVLGKMLMKPITSYANKTYAYADALVAVSETYLKRADVNHLPENLKAAVYIGAEQLFSRKTERKSDRLVVTYLGTMAGSYDLETIVRAAPLCDKRIDIQFVGTGPHEQVLKGLNRQLGGRVNFRGVYPYEEAMAIVVESDVALNPIKASSEGSITNKLSDYICAGLPILSCQEHPEVMQLLSLGGGIQYKAGDVQGLAKALNKLLTERHKLETMSQVNSKLAQEKFLRKISYLEIEKLIKNVM